MSNLYDDFEKRFTNAFFSANWADIEVQPGKAQIATETKIQHKDTLALQEELQEIQEHIENISQKQLRLSNLAKLYEN